MPDLCFLNITEIIFSLEELWELKRTWDIVNVKRVWPLWLHLTVYSDSIGGEALREKSNRPIQMFDLWKRVPPPLEKPLKPSVD